MLYFDGLCCGAVLEVEPSEVLIRSHEQQDRQEQLNASSSGSPEVVREALFSCLQVGKAIRLMMHSYQRALSDVSERSSVYRYIHRHIPGKGGGGSG